ncbi:MAG: twin-arginine translocation signal domain-containing protein, partial [Bacteroidales bacterium]
MTTRRDFLRTSLLGAAGLTLAPGVKAFGTEGALDKKTIMTVTGPISLSEAGTFLTHEHVLSRFGMEPAEPPVYEEQQVYSEVVPYLKYLKTLGIQTIADCTTAYFGRDAGILKELSKRSGMNIVANTGFYGAADDRYVPSFVDSTSPEKLAEKWIAEFNDGIEGSVKPGFIKTAIDSGGMSKTDQKLVEAAAITSKETGLSIAVHTGGNLEGARKEMDIFRHHGVNLNSWIWVHAQGADTGATVDAARKGAWISIDDLRQPYYDFKSQKTFDSSTLKEDLDIMREFK